MRVLPAIYSLLQNTNTHQTRVCVLVFTLPIKRTTPLALLFQYSDATASKSSEKYVYVTVECTIALTWNTKVNCPRHATQSTASVARWVNAVTPTFATLSCQYGNRRNL